MAKVNSDIVSEETALTVPTSSALDFLMNELVGEQQEVRETFRIPRLSIYVPGKKGSEFGADKGYWIDHLDGQTYDVNIDTLNVYRLDVPIMARVLWPFDHTDPKGKKLQGEAAGDPWCGSSDGIVPRSGERFAYVGKEIIDYRDHKPHAIPATCGSCVFSQWTNVHDNDGQLIMERDYKGNLRSVQGKPPCAVTPRVVLYDIDREMILVLQVSGYARVAHTLGGKTKQWGVLSGINDFYQLDPKTKRPPVVDAEGKLLALTMGVKKVDVGGGYGYQPVPTFTLGAPLTADQLLKLAEIKALYKEQNIRAIISGQSYTDYADEESLNTNHSTVADQPF